jgi:hypothetical protein
VFALRVVEELDVVEHILAGFGAGFILSASDAFALGRLKKLSATALSQQFPRRLMLGTRLCCSRNTCHA